MIGVSIVCSGSCVSCTCAEYVHTVETTNEIFPSSFNLLWSSRAVPPPLHHQDGCCKLGLYMGCTYLQALHTHNPEYVHMYIQSYYAFTWHMGHCLETVYASCLVPRLHGMLHHLHC